MVSPGTMSRRFLVFACLAAVLATAGCKSETAKHKAAGNVLFNQGDYETARDHYRKAVKADPDDSGARTLLGNAYVELHELELAREQFQRALELENASPEAHRDMMTVIAHTAKPGDAAAFEQYIGHAEALLAERPKDKNAIVMVGAITSEAANPDDPEAYAKAQDQAEQYLRRGLEIDDRDTKLLFHLALVYARKGDVTTAEKVLDRLASLAPAAGFADYAAAIVYTIAGDRDKAVARVEAMLATGDVDPDTLLASTSYLKPLHGDPAFTAAVEAARAARAK